MSSSREENEPTRIQERPATLDRDGEQIAGAVRRALDELATAIMGAERVMHYSKLDVAQIAAECRTWIDPVEHPLGSIEGGGIGDDLSERLGIVVSVAMHNLTIVLSDVGRMASKLEILCDRSRVLRSHGIHDVEPDLDR